MKKYLSLFRIRFIHNLQYRAAAYAGVLTQFTWGFMEILLFAAFYRADAQSFPMTLSQLSSYIWLQQAFFSMFATFMFDNDALDAISNGNIAYELARPINLYNMWFTKNLSMRFSRALLRCLPILIVSALIPAPYGLSAPAGAAAFGLFITTMITAAFVLTAFIMFIYISAFYTVNSKGVRMIAASAADFFTGAIIPLPFFPPMLRQIVELTPFAAMQNLPFRIYCGNIAGKDTLYGILLQIFWLVFMLLLGKIWMRAALKRVVVQGG